MELSLYQQTIKPIIPVSKHQSYKKYYSMFTDKIHINCGKGTNRIRNKLVKQLNNSRTLKVKEDYQIKNFYDGDFFIFCNKVDEVLLCLTPLLEANKNFFRSIEIYSMLPKVSDELDTHPHIKDMPKLRTKIVTKLPNNFRYQFSWAYCHSLSKEVIEQIVTYIDEYYKEEKCSQLCRYEPVRWSNGTFSDLRFYNRSMYLYCADLELITLLLMIAPNLFSKGYYLKTKEEVNDTVSTSNKSVD